eukprot:TRINITY_DN79193_c0_g1_i1.p1 TRINITY_DN79193_c0_g1~~TRINITY_DN79193_c0_g1_i1.p1  ORF type:complete len:722 (-),score=93.84 TRINITY_DN79193_c0_g1_i1:141-2306(-)
MAAVSGFGDLDKMVSDAFQRISSVVRLEHDALKAAIHSKLQDVQTNMGDEAASSSQPWGQSPGQTGSNKPISFTASPMAEPRVIPAHAPDLLMDVDDISESSLHLEDSQRGIESQPGGRGLRPSAEGEAFAEVLPGSLNGVLSEPNRGSKFSTASLSALNLVPRPEFKEDAGTDKAKLLSFRSGWFGLRRSRLTSEERAYTDSTVQSSRSGFGPVHPDSFWGRLWDILSILCITHDFIFLPLQVFYDDADRMSSATEISVSVYWALNIPAKFCIGYVDEHGMPVRIFSSVAKRYAKTWLGFDLTLVAIDLISLVIDNASSFRLLLALRLVRILRLARVFDFVKLIRTWVHLHVRTEGFNILFGILRITIVMLGVAHLFTCSWYYVGTLDAENSWPKSHGILHGSVGLRYVTSLHWALVQYSGDSSIEPMNGWERLLACAVQVVAFLFSAVIVSDLTTIMTQLQVLSAYNNRQILVLKRFLYDKKVSTRLANRIIDNARLSLEEMKRNPPEHTVELLAHISAPLLTELHYHVNADHLKANQFFGGYDAKNAAGMRALCHYAVRMDLVAEQDVIYSAGELKSSPCLYFVTDDGLLYYCQGSSVRHITRGTCVNDPVLWIADWMQMGTLEAQKSSHVLSFIVLEALKVMQQYRTAEFYPSRYAQQFVSEIRGVDFDSISDISSDYMDLRDIADNIFGDVSLLGRSALVRSRTKFNLMRTTTSMK